MNLVTFDLTIRLNRQLAIVNWQLERRTFTDLKMKVTSSTASQYLAESTKRLSKLLMLIFSICLLMHCENANKNRHCTDVKNGHFVLNDKITGESYFIERNDSFQIETTKSSGLKKKARVTWINDCVYKLTYFPLDPAHYDATDSFFLNRPAFVTIKEINAKYYTFSFKVDTFSRTFDGTMFILK